MKMWLFFQKPNMAEGEATPVVEAKRLVERNDEGMSQSYHEIFDTQVERRSTRTANWIQLHIIFDRATAETIPALAQSQVPKKAAVEVV